MRKMIQKFLIALLKIIYKNDFERMAVCSKQDEGVFVEQHLWGGIDDCYYGNIFFPIKNQKFLRVPFDD